MALFPTLIVIILMLPILPAIVGMFSDIIPAGRVWWKYLLSIYRAILVGLIIGGLFVTLYSFITNFIN